MSEPNWNFGDVNDDDADTINELVESEAKPPTPEELPIAKGPDIPIPLPKPSRMMTHTARYPNTTGPVMAVPEDPRRTMLTIHVHGTTDIFFAQDRSALVMGMSTAFVIASPGVLELRDYTGALWIAPDPEALSTDVFSYSIVAVTA